MAALSSLCVVTVSVLWFFFMVPWVAPHFVIVVFPDHTLLYFNMFHIFLTTAITHKRRRF